MLCLFRVSGRWRDGHFESVASCREGPILLSGYPDRPRHAKIVPFEQVLLITRTSEQFLKTTFFGLKMGIFFWPQILAYTSYEWYKQL